MGKKLFDSLPIGIAVVDYVSDIIYEANEAYCGLLGMERMSLIGTKWMNYTHPDDIAKDREYISKLFTNAVSCSCRDKRYLHSDGTIVHVRVKITPIYGLNDKRVFIAMVENRQINVELANERRKRLTEAFRIQESYFPSMAIFSEFRDRETGEHLLRTSAYVRLILSNLPFENPFSKKAIRIISFSAMLHDIGKIGIPDCVLLKEGTLDAAEFEIMKTHTTLGKQAIMATRKWAVNDSVFIFAQEIAEYHHERWDGTGYPKGLKEAEIPLTARIMAIADVYDALRSERSYKKALSHEESMEIMRASGGTHLDPELASAFCAMGDIVEKIAVLEKSKLEKIYTDIPEEE